MRYRALFKTGNEGLLKARPDKGATSDVGLGVLWVAGFSQWDTSHLTPHNVTATPLVERTPAAGARQKTVTGFQNRDTPRALNTITEFPRAKKRNAWRNSIATGVLSFPSVLTGNTERLCTQHGPSEHGTQCQG
ncbi:hypothetical protein SKAU_G00369170 [Synaphobranchus kaupii]|uniref:Uncharacterized protein n=1 Tax=Synaphobranchus kaupii TaxID=118154 RepID=A0A9Q1IFT4_SYNKA|nr:hypothetical protein SKAU_G00369170 [Synaphobranchus kaupii]